MLTTLRSHDQYNTTIYGMNDRYRGVFGRRDVVFMNKDDLSARGLTEGDKIDIIAALYPNESPSASKTVRGFTVVTYDIPKGSVAGYYPEMNSVIALGHYDRKSGTPAYKGCRSRCAAPSDHTGKAFHPDWPAAGDSGDGSHEKIPARRIAGRA